MKLKKENNPEKPQETQREVEIQVVEEESRGKRILNTVVNILLVVAIAVAAMCTYVSYVSTSGNGVPSILGIRMFSIQTESMYPTLLPGDLIFDVAVKDAGELRKGDIITYWTVINGERVLNTHRVYEIYDGGGYLIFSTKGDNNTSADALTVHESEIVGKYSLRVSGVGKVFDYLQTSTGFLIVIVIPVFLFFLFHLVQFFRVLFEYQNVKNRIKFEQERGRTEDLIAAQQRQHSDAQAEARAKMEAELRERLRAEIMASMMPQQQTTSSVAPAAEAAPEEQEAPAVEEKPVIPEKKVAVVETKFAAAEEKPKVVKMSAVQKPSVIEDDDHDDISLEDLLASVADLVAEDYAAEEVSVAVKNTVVASEPVVDAVPAEETDPIEEKIAPVMDADAIEALIAKQRAAFEAQLREKLLSELMTKTQLDQEENKAEKTENAAQV